MEVISSLSTTTWIIIVTALVWLVWDIYAFVSKKHVTFSDKITKWSYYSPMVPFILGMLMGHWFWTTNVCN